jgi:hypothetical protein
MKRIVVIIVTLCGALVVVSLVGAMVLVHTMAGWTYVLFPKAA